MSRKRLTSGQLRALERVCVQFIEDQDIGHPEVIFQCDRVSENALPFIQLVADVVGYATPRED